MRKKIFRCGVVALIIVHLYFLLYWGIATISTTLLFYFIIYKIAEFCIKKLFSIYWAKLFCINLKVFIFLLIILELFLFIFQIGNIPEENRYKIYFSTYKREKQIDLINFLSNKERKLGWTNGYIPFEKYTYTTTDFEFNTIYNRLGLRGNIFNISDTNKFRIIILGDSFVEGFGAPDDSTFPYLLEKQFGKDTVILNAGICGSNPINEIQLYHNKFQKIPSNLVLLTINHTDLEDIEYTIHKNKIPIAEYFVAISHVFRFINAGIFKNDMNIKYPNKKTAERRKENIQLMLDKIKSFQEELAKNKIRFVVIYLPLSNEIVKKDTLNTTDILHNEIVKSNLPLIDLLSDYPISNMQNIDSLNTYYWRHDAHHTPKGYAMMAKEVAKQLTKKNSTLQKSYLEN